jgi:hypothetical protein
MNIALCRPRPFSTIICRPHQLLQILPRRKRIIQFLGVRTVSTNANSLFDLTPVSPEKETEAVVILLGWWGAEKRHVHNYGKLFQQRNCATIIGVSDKMVTFCVDEAALSVYAQECAVQTATLLRHLETEQKRPIPVIFHLFSNGGCFVFEQMELLFQKASVTAAAEKEKSTQKDAAYPDLLLVRDRLGGQIFDSSPAYLTVHSGTAALEGAFPNVFVASILKGILLSMHGAKHVFEKLFGIPPRIETFWNRYLESNVCRHQAFVYSSHDRVTDHVQLDKFIQARRNKFPDPTIMVKKFDDSEHCTHYPKHKEEYTRFVFKFLDMVISDGKKK